VTTLPPVVVDSIGRVLVARDDLLPGGSKRRAVGVLLDGASHHVYGGPAQGYAQVALAYACQDRGHQCTLFVAERMEKHRLTVEAQEAGATVVEVPDGMLSVVQARSRDFSRFHGARLQPLGFDVPAFVDALADVARSTRLDPPEVWCVCSTGTLARALSMAFPRARLNLVLVGMAPKRPLPAGARIMRAPERYEVSAKSPPPYPSASNYDAKLWQFASREAVDGALLWNVGR